VLAAVKAWLGDASIGRTAIPTASLDGVSTRANGTAWVGTKKRARRSNKETDLSAIAAL
jgi:hypothetical protein